ncbi:MAG: lyase [Balneolia bacterium]|nr:lyase [Balneolia bacterium]
MKPLFTGLLAFSFLIACGQNGEENTSSSYDEASSENGDIIISVDMWDVPFETSRSRDPFASPNGMVYFAGQRADYIGYLNPATSEMGYFELSENAGPHTVVVADDGMLWYAGNRDRHIGKIDPETGEITRFDMEEPFLQDPHTFAFDADGNIWFSSQRANGIGHFNVETGEVRGVEVPVANARPYGVRMSPENTQPWISMMGTSALATVNPETMEIEMVELPRETIRVRRLDVASNGTVWYGDFSSGYIGSYNPENGDIQEWEMPDGEESRPYAVLFDDQDRLWMSTTGFNPNKLVGFDIDSKEFIADQIIDQASGSIRHMMFDSNTSSLWFGTDTGYVGRLVLN